MSEMLLPAFPVGERGGNLSGDRTHKAVVLNNDTIGLLQDNTIIVILENLLFKGREQAALHPEAKIVDAEIHAKKINSIVLEIGKEHLFW